MCFEDVNSILNVTPVVPISGRREVEFGSLFRSASLRRRDRFGIRGHIVVDPGPRLMNFRVAPSTQLDRDLVRQFLSSIVRVLQMMFFEQRGGIFVCEKPLFEAATTTRGRSLSIPEMWAVVPRPFAVRIGCRTAKAVFVTLVREFAVMAGVFDRVSTPAVVGEVIAPFDDLVGIFDADGCPFGCLYHEFRCDSSTLNLLLHRSS